MQVSGKLRGSVIVDADASEKDVMAAAKADANVAKHLDGKEVRKEIYVKGKLVNIVV